MLVNRADSHTSGARFVGQPACEPERWIKTKTAPNQTGFYPQTGLFPKSKKTYAKKDACPERNFYIIALEFIALAFEFLEFGFAFIAFAFELWNLVLNLSLLPLNFRTWF